MCPIDQFLLKSKLQNISTITIAYQESADGLEPWEDFSASLLGDLSLDQISLLEPIDKKNLLHHFMIKFSF